MVERSHVVLVLRKLRANDVFERDNRRAGETTERRGPVEVLGQACGRMRLESLLLQDKVLQLLLQRLTEVDTGRGQEFVVVGLRDRRIHGAALTMNDLRHSQDTQLAWKSTTTALDTFRCRVKISLIQQCVREFKVSQLRQLLKDAVT